jgi:hypothetical protein
LFVFSGVRIARYLVDTKKSLKIPMEQSESVYRSRKDKTMDNEEKTKQWTKKKRQNNGQRRKDKTIDNEEKTKQWTKKKRQSNGQRRKDNNGQRRKDKTMDNEEKTTMDKEEKGGNVCNFDHLITLLLARTIIKYATYQLKTHIEGALSLINCFTDSWMLNFQ